MIPRTVWMLGFVSLFMGHVIGAGSQPVAGVPHLDFGASVLTVGVIEGLAEAAALIAKVFSGAMRDYFRNRKGSSSWAMEWRR